MKILPRIAFFTAFIFLLLVHRGDAQEISIDEIKNKINSLDAVSFETTSTGSTSPDMSKGKNSVDETKIWIKKPGYTRKEIHSETDNTKRIIQVFTPQGGAIYNSYSDAVEKTDVAGQWVPFLEFQLVGLSRNDPARILGTEEIGGKLTTVIEVTTQLEGGPFGGPGTTEMKTKSWIWNEKGVPLKHETITTFSELPMVVKTFVEYKNYNFDMIPDSVFELTDGDVKSARSLAGQ
jgi:outer membrane lipoprotein-sorting protein